MKTPQKISPVESNASTELGAGSPPEILLTALVSTADEETAPKNEPPAASSTSTDDAITAGVWYNDKRVNALYTTYHSKNSWIGIVGIGWVKLAVSNDSANEAMTILASHARVKNSQINYSLDAGLVNEMYVW